ncbi:MAG: transposase [Bdellovibrionales bacterium]|nr:transposase [Bdellovibrionales bacterium]
MNWQELLPGVKPGGDCCLGDSGYDNKKLQRFFISQGWDFVGSIKKSRSVKTLTQYWQSVSDLSGEHARLVHGKLSDTKRAAGKNERKVVSERWLAISGCKP